MPQANTGQSGGLRERNLARVIDALRRRRTASRSDLARMTGLSRTTVGTLVAELQEQGLVVEHADTGQDQAGPGRPPVLLRLDPSAGVAVGIDFDHDRVRVALADLSSTVLGEDSIEVDVDHSAADALDAAVAMLSELQRTAQVTKAQLIGAGVGLPGPVDQRTGTVGSSLILPGWAGLPARLELEHRLGLPVEIDNDANLGGLAEASFGAGRGMSEIVYVRVASGLGAGLVVGGRVHRGHVGLAGEIGHVQVRPDGAVCRCGSRGCLETIAAEGALAALLRPAHGRDMSGPEILELVSSGDLGARRVLADAGRAIGRVLADLCNVLNPEAIVVGGAMSAAGEPLLGGIREAVDRFALPGAAEVVRVLRGELGERVGLLGALTLVIGNTESLSSRGLPAFAGWGAAEPSRLPQPGARREEVPAGR
jgi:predicted NBD/HSP70 family sugar kinase